MKRIISLLLSISILLAFCPATIADYKSEEAMIEQYFKAMSSGFTVERFNNHLSFSDNDYAQLIDLDGDGKDELIQFMVEAANPHLRIYYVDENGFYEYFAYDDRYTGTSRVTDIDLIKKENGYTLRICRTSRGGVTAEINGQLDIIGYAISPSSRYITFNAQNHSTTEEPYSFSVNEDTGEYDFGNFALLSKADYDKTVAPLNQGEIISIFKEHSYALDNIGKYVYEGTVKSTPSVADMNSYEFSPTSTVHSTEIEFIKRLSDIRCNAAKEKYAAYKDITSELSDEDKLWMQNAIYNFQSYEPELFSALNEEQILARLNSALGFSAEIESEHSIHEFSFFKNSDVEELIRKYTGNRIDLKNHKITMDDLYFEFVWELGDNKDKVKELLDSGEYFVGTSNSYSDIFDIPIINLIYSIGDNQYLVIYNNVSYNEYDHSKLLNVDYLKDKNISYVDIGNYQYAIMEKSIYNGTNEYYMVECGGNEGLIELDRLQKYVHISNEPSNISIDYNEVKKYTEPSMYVDYLRSALEGVTPNNSAKSEIVKFIEYAIENVSDVKIRAINKKLTIKANDIKNAVSKSEELKSSFENLLTEKGITLNKNIDIIIKADTLGVKLEKGVTVIYNSSLSELLERIGGIKVIYDANRQSVTAQSSSIKAMLEQGKNSVKLTQNNNQYTIDFLGADDITTGTCAGAVTFAFKSSNPNNTVYYEQNGEKKNWSGQVNVNDDTIEFMTALSGTYYVEENQNEIFDIGNLSEEQQKAVKFMVSRGYFDLIDGAFNPYGSLSRNDFAKALVSIFYVLDFNGECTFTDVPKENIYYNYIASSQKNNIVEGFDDNTFRGEKDTTREEVISISARTLANKKGYSYPENTDDYVQFVDNEKIADWENQFGEISLAVREGLIEKGGLLSPKRNVTRLDAAVILYRLFNLLYDTSPAQIATSSTTGNFPVIPVAVGGGVAVIGVAAAVFAFRREKAHYSK